MRLGGRWRALAAFFGGRLCSADADDEGAAGCFDDVVGDGVQVVDLHDAVDLDEQPLDEPEVSAGDAGDRGYGLGVGEVVWVEGEAEAVPVSVEDEAQFGYRLNCFSRPGMPIRMRPIWSRS